MPVDLQWFTGANRHKVRTYGRVQTLLPHMHKYLHSHAYSCIGCANAHVDDLPLTITSLIILASQSWTMSLFPLSCLSIFQVSLLQMLFFICYLTRQDCAGYNLLFHVLSGLSAVQKCNPDATLLAHENTMHRIGRGYSSPFRFPYMPDRHSDIILQPLNYLKYFPI